MLSKIKTKIIFAFSTIVLCLALLVSTTWSLFTDEDKVTTRVTAGDLDIQLFQANEAGEYVDIENAPDSYNVFGDFAWEPNATKVVFFKIVNNSDIRIKYSFQMDVEDENFTGALEYVAFSSQYFDVKGKTWASFKAGYDVEDLVKGANTLSGATYVAMEPHEEAYYAVAVHMKDVANNNFQDRKTSIDVAVFAIQGNYQE